MAPGLNGEEPLPVFSFGSCFVRSFPKSLDVVLPDIGNNGRKIISRSAFAMPSQLEYNFCSQMKLEPAPFGHGHNVSQGNVEEFGLISCRDWGGLPVDKYKTWPVSVTQRWERVNLPKNGNELGLLSWNVNGRLDLRGCRESLIRS